MEISKKISKNYAIDITFLQLWRWSESLEFCFEIVFKTKDSLEDHTPQFGFTFMLFSIMILDVAIYNMNHLEPEIEEEKETKNLKYFVVIEDYERGLYGCSCYHEGMDEEDKPEAIVVYTTPTDYTRDIYLCKDCLKEIIEDVNDLVDILEKELS
jgi:hypothetical protein